MITATAVITNETDLRRAADRGRKSLLPRETKLIVGMGTCGLAAGAEEVFEAIRDEVQKQHQPYMVASTACIGWCSQEPLVDVQVPGKPRVTYGRMDVRKARELVRCLAKGDLKLQWASSQLVAYDNLLTGKPLAIAESSGRLDGLPCYGDLALFKHQLRIVLRNCGVIDPSSLDEYIARGGYFALHHVLKDLSPADVIGHVLASGLRGRGGAGFPTGRKWKLLSEQAAAPKYLICNGDEGDPGAYMDRAVLEGDPHSVLEGMAIGAYATGASEGIIYVRDEYPLAVQRMTEAIKQAEDAGLLGDKILGKKFSFTVRIAKGAGAFVCGEETALIRSVEGHVGEPVQRPPFPVQKGLYGKPTAINNVETWANIPVILMRGGEWFASIGTATSKGTKVFSLVGAVNNTALIEVPMGIKLREIVNEVGGGIPNKKKFKAIQTGGPSGGCLPADLLDLEVDYESLTRSGAIMGSGGMIVMDESNCMVDIAKYFLTFLADESCGKCFSCRKGLERMQQIVTRIAEGNGSEEDLALLEDLGWLVRETSLCGLGQTAPNPLLSTLRYFRDEFLAHVREKRCPAKVCKQLITYHIEPALCDGCGACIQVCASEAILGEKKSVHRIEAGKCIKCGACLEVCRPKAVLVN
jgi:NADH:ubiquinone oxidoreductase subunit F (NADH-binding)/(2Fe-2S) ferredoxin/Pyruvate/2-oxoacid:ferredoxin oxidoreductase delta subunit